MATSRHISIGFQASMPLALRVSQEQLDALLAALGGDGWHDVEGDDGTVRLSLGNVLWVRADREEHRVGFGA
ncbi:MAG TPA: hypothetical protein VGW75_13190 [Solirubrobacteraceae bacterium]|jgi:hypothetical protein|nr:hypothetical protein [Solirubrobacteraceae bacterium]